MIKWNNCRALFVLISLGLFSCAHNGQRSEGGLFSVKGEGGLLNSGQGRSISSHDSLEQDILGVSIQNREFDLPVVYNDEVRDWVRYFTGVGRKHFSVYLERKAMMEPVIIPKLKQAGMPLDLIYLAMIESGFSTQAHSHMGAVGPWQFIRSTGRLYGLKSDWWIDERKDPHKSTDAAIKYLSRLHEEFGDWSLACSAYNSGELRIRRAISKLNTRDFWVIARNRRALRRETKDYVPKMMAAAIIGKNAEQFGFETHPVDTKLMDYEEVTITKAENLNTIARVAGISKKELQMHNPDILRCCTPPQVSSFTIRVPKGESKARVLAAIDSGELGRFDGFRRHVIRRGDTLSRIAANAGVPVQSILSMNEISSARSLRPGTELVIPERGGKTSGIFRSVASEGRKKAPKGTVAVTYTVRKGDTLYGISRRHGVGVDQIRRWNSISRAKNLRPGKQIKLYVKNDNNKNI
ncbi:MAG: LysM peptidoglycan-binding domain-containing protein [Oligoflexia bacterium]|nr:LysM peptidoglycan-binding domain-containing protein [Oligoflexia bacterium]